MVAQGADPIPSVEDVVDSYKLRIDILNYKNNLLDEIKHRYNKYSIEVFNEKIHFNFSLVEDIVNQTVRL